MPKSLAALVSMVSNNVSGGLRGQANFTYSREQIADEIALTRNAILKEYALKGVRLSRQDLVQQVAHLRVELRDLTGEQGGPVLAGLPLPDSRTPYVRLPALSTLLGSDCIEYLGGVNLRSDLKRSWDPVPGYAEFDLLTGRQPYVWLDGQGGWLLNLKGSFSVQRYRVLTLRAVLEDPMSINEFEGNSLDWEDPYPMPDFIADQVVQKITNKYISMYGRLNPQPNNGVAAI